MELHGYRFLTKVMLLKREHFTLGFLVNYMNCNFCRNILFSVSVDLSFLFTVEETRISGFGNMRRKTSDNNTQITRVAAVAATVVVVVAAAVVVVVMPVVLMVVVVVVARVSVIGFFRP